MIRAGFSEIDITPQLGAIIPGQFEAKIASGIKDPLYAKGFVIDNGEKVLALVAVDTLGIDYSVVRRIRERAGRLTGISPGSIMVSATHTHTGGPVMEFGKNVKPDPEYIGLLAEKAADAVAIAHSRLTPAAIGSGTGFENGISFIRRFFMKDGTYRTNPSRMDPNIDRADGVIDPEVVVARIDDLNGNALGVVTNFACHLDCVGGTEFSADYPGEMSKVIKKVLGNNAVSVFLTGTCGNINHIDFYKGSDMAPGHYAKMGRILAGEVLKVREKINMVSDVGLDVKEVCFDAACRIPSAEDILKAESIAAAGPDEGKGVSAVDYYYALEIIRLAKKGIISDKMDIQAYKIGDMAIVGLPGEVFVEYGLEIKKNSSFKFNMVNTLANGCTGYIPTKEAYERGGYEPRLNTYSKLTPEACVEMLQRALETLSALK